MCVELPSEDLNLDPYSSHLINIYIYELTIVPKVRSDSFFFFNLSTVIILYYYLFVGMNSISITTRSSTIAEDYSSIRRSEMCL